MSSRVALYSSIGEELIHYEVDVEGAALVKRGSVRVPASVQCAWPHPSKQYLYVASSNRGPGTKADVNHLSAFRIDPGSGALTRHGEPRPHRYRAVHVSLDASGSYALIAHSEPSGITVNRINSDGTIGQEVNSREALDCGIYPHQVRTTPSNRTAILVTRGNSATSSKPEEPGALKLFSFHDGVLANNASIAPGGGYGFRARHLDFHPTRPWVYLSLEAQNKLCLFYMQGDGLAPEAAFIRDTLADPGNVEPKQHAGTLHVHPNGQFIYVANRADWMVDFGGQKVFGGGENSLAVYSLDSTTGEPKLIQHADPQSFQVRTFAMDPSGRVLVAASTKSMAVREGTRVTTTPAGLSVFRIGSDGKLTFMRKYDVDTGGKTQFWMGIVGLP